MFFVSCESEIGESVLWLCTVVRGSLAATKPVSGAESKRMCGASPTSGLSAGDGRICDGLQGEEGDGQQARAGKVARGRDERDGRVVRVHTPPPEPIDQ